MGEVLDRVKAANQKKALNITTLKLSKESEEIKVTSDSNFDGGYMLDTLLLQQAELGFIIEDLEINAKKVIGKVIALLDGVKVDYSWDNRLGMWCS